ncbi:MAG: 16S rRNA (cytidine1402-2'-O)-methyltransferase [Alphaproteobacteria bacterium]|jgi:16S rRNA (cytidine1402-2'-O)-methyltransferase
MELGKLYLVGVPIGNYNDMTFRAIETLKKVDVVAAEDTRKAKKLLTHFLIKDKITLAHGSHNEHSSANGLVSLLQKGQSMAYISDAGMPGVSDPGYMLVRAALQAGIEVKVVPGVTAAVTAVSISGIPCDRFTFQGFIPRKQGERERFLNNLEKRTETQIFYEAPHRVVEMVEALANIFPERACTIGREITKIHEEFIRGTVASVLEDLQNKEAILGEFTIIMSGHSGEVEIDFEAIDKQIIEFLKAGERAKAIRDVIAKETGLAKSEIYTRILDVKKTFS